MKLLLNRMRIIRNIVALTTGFLILLLLSNCHSQEKTLPNFIIIFADDQGYADVGCYGAEGFTTPNIDKLAAEGARFTDFYASQAVCSASRASLLTGCYSERVGITGALSPNAKVGLNPNEITIAELLKDNGYKTAIFGKWHLGDDTTFSPLNNGFDEYYGLPYSNDMWPVKYDGSPADAGHKTNYPVLTLMDGKSADVAVNTLEDQSTLTTIYTSKAIDFIQRNNDKPFFLYLPHSMPHVPLGVSSKFDGKSEQGMYGDVIMEMDWSLGKIMETLEKYGLRENTIVIYTSDNGPWLNYGNHAGSAYPLREGKGTAWEGGCRVPAIISWPGVIEDGMEINSITSTIDILPTIADIIDAELPNHTIDGISFKEVLTGQNASGHRDEFYYFYERSLCAVRKGNWKLVFPHRYRSYQGVDPGNDGFPGPYAFQKSGLELYNLKYDKGEKHDSSQYYPEIVNELSKIGDSVRQELGDNITKTRGKAVRKPGRILPSEYDTISHIGEKAEISVSVLPNYLYEANGPTTLINGIRGSYDFKDEQWIGFWGDDIEINLEFDSVVKINHISLGALQSQGAWIFLPSNVIISTSEDGIKYREQKTFKVAKQQKKGTNVRYFFSEFDIYAKHIRLLIKNPGPCPEWHSGAGGDSWVFIDEVVVK